MVKYRSKRDGIYRSRVEKAVGDALAEQGFPALYEAASFPYVQAKKYTPDFTINGSHIEVKGWWPASDRAKLLAVIRQNPSIRILVALDNPHMTISKNSKTTYAQWCQRHGIKWSPIPIPPDALAQWLGIKRTSHAQAQTATAAMAPRPIQTDLFTALSVNPDTSQTAPHGKVA
jgi:hypothetical protein